MKRPKQDKLLEAWRKLSAGDVIRLMIASVKNPAIKDTFGNIIQVRVLGPIPPNTLPKYECVACAATNTLLRLMGKRPKEATMVKFIEQGFSEMCGYLGEYVGSKWDTVNSFESAINQLRTGMLGAYNYHVKELGGIAYIQWPPNKDQLQWPKNQGYYPPLTNNTWHSRVGVYEKLAQYNDQCERIDTLTEEKTHVTK